MPLARRFASGAGTAQIAGMSTAILQLRLRVYCGREAALGPGRAELLERVAGTASIAQAARDMGMSYMKAWKLVQSMNRCFREPLVEVQRGGKSGGVARLTPLGREALELYRRMEAASVAATRPFEEEMTRMFALTFAPAAN